MLQARTEHGKMVTESGGYLICPQCGRQKLLRIQPETAAVHLPVYCKHCRSEIILNIGKLSLSQRA